MSVEVIHADCNEAIKSIADASIDACVTDPPYALVSIVKRLGGANAAPIKDRDGVYKRAAAGFMGKQWDTGDTAFDPAFWREVLRVLKPGAHLLAFGGTRTYHRLACAIEDAGFEIRDQIGWLYGSGFPKSHDVSKGIDKAAGTVGGRGAVKGKSGSARNAMAGDFAGGEYHEYTPATDAARQWQGWGTALKPAWEPIVLARKPLASLGANVVEMVEFQLRQRGVTGVIQWKRGSANVAERASSRTSSSSTEAPQAGETSAANAGASATESDEQQTVSSFDAHGTDGRARTETASPRTAGGQTENFATKSSPPTAVSASAAASEKNVSSPSTTSTAAEPLTESKFTARSIPISGDKGFRPGIECFAGIATGLSGFLAHALIVRDEDGVFVWPDDLPQFGPGRPLTVAANVLSHGTGAINVDGCRVAAGSRPLRVGDYKQTADNVYEGRQDGSLMGGSKAVGDTTLGRWPANVIHDGSEEVVEAFPDTRSGSGAIKRATGAGYKANAYGAESRPVGTPMISHGDTGYAARFFYSAKADAADRLGSKHPTVKPVDLMAYLIRLVTPKGGLVLDPFAGSGTTGMAAMREGVRAVLIEREAEYVADIRLRIAHVRGEDSPLFNAVDA